MTIFGEEHFLDETMCSIAHSIDDILIDTILKESQEVGINIDKEKLKRWLILCGKLEHIDKGELIDMAIKKKFEEKDFEISVLLRALDLACDELNDAKSMLRSVRQDDFASLLNDSSDYFRKKAKYSLGERK